MSKNAKIVVLLIVSILLIAVVPLFLLKGAEFGGTDDAGAEMVTEVTGKEFKPWFKPILETFLGRELPVEVESLIFCLQTGIGVGIIAYCFGYLVARKKYSREEAA